MSEPKSEYKVEVKNLTKYFGDLHVLNDISFNVRKGEFICIVGPTGCGKTTFLNLLTRIYMPSKGDLLIDGESADPKKHNLAFVFQEPSSIPWKTVEENLRFGLELKKLPKKEIDERVENIIKLMGLQNFRDAYPHQLSVSTEQRIIIGRAFAMNPDLLLMDEPYGALCGGGSHGSCGQLPGRTAGDPGGCCRAGHGLPGAYPWGHRHSGRPSGRNFYSRYRPAIH